MILLRQASVILTSPRKSTLMMISSVLMLNSSSRSLTKANHTSHRSNSISTRPLSTPLADNSTMPRSILCMFTRVLASALQETPWAQAQSFTAPSSESSSIWKRAAPPRTHSLTVSLLPSMTPPQRSICASSSALLTWETTGAMMVPLPRPLALKVLNGVSLGKFSLSPRLSLISSRQRWLTTLKLPMVTTESSCLSMNAPSSTVVPPSSSLALQLLSLPLPPSASDERHQTNLRFLHHRLLRTNHALRLLRKRLR